MAFWEGELIKFINELVKNDIFTMLNVYTYEHGIYIDLFECTYLFYRNFKIFPLLDFPHFLLKFMSKYFILVLLL